MFGFDGEDKGFRIILDRIATNPGEGGLTHKEVRAYARCLLVIFPTLSLLPVDSKIESEIKVLLAMMSSAGLPHYDRSFLASRILELLDKQAQKAQSTEGYF
jgi:hypothetical protein